MSFHLLNYEHVIVDDVFLKIGTRNQGYGCNGRENKPATVIKRRCTQSSCLLLFLLCKREWGNYSSAKKGETVTVIKGVYSINSMNRSFHSRETQNTSERKNNGHLQLMNARMSENGFDKKAGTEKCTHPALYSR
jgi:hypothetical protein